MEAYVEYLRKSRLDRDYTDMTLEETLKRHKAILDKLAVSRGYYVAKTYYEVVSGESIAARPEVQKLLEEVGEGMYAGVLVVDVDRLARGNSIDQGIISQTFQYSGTKIITPTKVYDPSNEFDEEYFEFGLFMSRREYKTITRRLVRGRESSASEGKFVGSAAPYGYKRVKIPREKGFTLEIVPEEAALVKKMFEMYADHHGITAIANYLNDLKVPSKGGDKWHQETVRGILKNPVYCGKIRRGYSKVNKIVKDGVVIGKKQRVDEANARIYDGLHEPIVSEELFERAQQARKDMTREVRCKDRFTVKNPFAGLLYCDICGQRMVRKIPTRPNDATRISCYGQRYCHNSSGDFAILEKLILEGIKNWFERYQIKLDTVGYAEEIQAQKDEIDYLDKQIEKSKAQLDKAFDLVEKGIYTLDVFAKRQEKLTKEIDDLKERRTISENEVARLENTVEASMNIIPATQHLLEYYDEMTVEERNALLKEILTKITYSREPKGEIKINLFPRFPA